jgi:hypothetical protein
MAIDPKAVLDAKKKVLKPEVAGLKANPSDVANYKKLKQQKAKEELDAANKGVDEDAEEKKHNRKTCSCEKCKRARYIADHVDREDWPNDMKESTNISNFLKSISQKNYAQADKYLQGTVESKLKAIIDKAVKNSTIYAK